VQSILVLRGHRVLLDSELADLHGVATKRFNEQVKRNLARFPADFMFQLSTDESVALRSQFATLKPGRGQHRKYRPYAFTEHGAIMAATILNSPRAVEMSVCIRRYQRGGRLGLPPTSMNRSELANRDIKWAIQHEFSAPRQI
jgi:hypothetical protein